MFVVGTGSNWTEGRRKKKESSLPGPIEPDTEYLGMARAFESKHGHLLLRGSSRSSIEEPGQSTSIGTSIDY